MQLEEQAGPDVCGVSTDRAEGGARPCSHAVPGEAARCTGVVRGQVPWMVRVRREGKRSRTGPCTGQGMRGGLAILDRQCPRGGNPETRKCAGKRQTAREGGSGCQTP